MQLAWQCGINRLQFLLGPKHTAQNDFAALFELFKQLL
jgi:hypothetical protein